jgi:hypothetical protein
MNLVGHPKDRDQNSFEMTSDLIISVFITSVNQNLNHEFFFLNFFFFFCDFGPLTHFSKNKNKIKIKKAPNFKQ